jgi:uncharacterized protein (DUF1810 family)
VTREPQERFVAAQEGAVGGALNEVRRGRKLGHWMWFVYPQLAGLGRSDTSVHYAIADLDEARAYLADPVLGPRLRAAAEAVLAAPTQDAEEIFGAIDAVKLRSSMTLFDRAAPEEPVFRQVLERCFGGEADPRTLELLGPTGGPRSP